MVGRRAAATTEDVDPTVVGKLTDDVSHSLRAEIELAHVVGQVLRWDDS